MKLEPIVELEWTVTETFDVNANLSHCDQACPSCACRIGIGSWCTEPISPECQLY